jgi:hypothetical protein
MVGEKGENGMGYCGKCVRREGEELRFLFYSGKNDSEVVEFVGPVGSEWEFDGFIDGRVMVFSRFGGEGGRELKRVRPGYYVVTDGHWVDSYDPDSFHYGFAVCGQHGGWVRVSDYGEVA